MPRKGGVPENLTKRKKGAPGLPGAGRPKQLPALEEIVKKVLGEGGENNKSGIEEIILSLKRAATSKKLSATAVRAAELLLERAYGKVVQPIEATVHERKSLIFVAVEETPHEKIINP